MPAPLRVACWSGPASDDLAANARAVEAALADAARAGARVLLTPECVLCGYPGAARPDLAGIDGCRLAELEDRLALRAERLGLLLVLGSAGPDGRGGWSNDAVCCGAVPAVRHRKRALTPGDTACFSPGARPTRVAIDGWNLGVSICYEVRFPALWDDADGWLCIAHMAGGDPDPGTKAQVVPALYAARAAEWAAPLALANTAAADRWLDSAVWDARGMRIAGGVAMVVAGLVHRESLDPWYRRLHADQAAQRQRPEPSRAGG